MLNQISSAMGQGLHVTAATQRTSCRYLETDEGFNVRLLAQPMWPPRSRPAGTFTITVILDGPETNLYGEQAEAALTVAKRVPLTSLEQRELTRQMPLTAGIPEHLPPNCLSHIAPVLTVHHMYDFLVMVEALQRLGVPPEAMTVLDKGYRYRNTQRVDAHLEAQRVRVWPWNDAATALKDHVARACGAERKGVLVDDGGYTLPVLMEQCPELLTDFVGLVEQTASGIAKLAKYPDLPMPVFSVAESRLKAAIEPYGIADAAVRNLRALVPEEKWEGQAACVLGFGRIGSALAEVLRQKRMRVAVHDTSTEALVTAMEQGFETSPDLHALLRRHQPILVMGTTGATSLRGEHAASLLRDCYLVSVTSRDREFALTELRAAAEDIEDAGQVGSRLGFPHGTRATLIADGYPINFHWAESLPNKYADLVLASLIVGTTTLAHPDHGFAPGHNVARTDARLAESGLLERYYACFGPRNAAREPAA
ncbi:NAD(P)-dependent oxidoreductase [Streptomyces sp. TR02-1]|uniref:NAD(P)-dependent oxidoreductase n=1 Tax=Streptomyces sp. TR02-1 TaxID=3385977 RepID=UPI0039A123FE